jgi:hypothetical protein
MSIFNKILNDYPSDGYNKVIGFDDAVVGISTRSCLVYSVDKCIEILIKEGFDYQNAVDHFYNEIDSMYVGKNAPIFIQTI